MSDRREFRMMSKLSGRGGFRVVACALGLFCAGARLTAATPGAAEDAGKGAAVAAAGTNVAAIPFAEVAAQAEAAFATLQSVNGNLSADRATEAIQQDLPVLTRESSARLEESSKMLASNPSLETLRRLNREWQGFSEELAEWKANLLKRVTQLGEDHVRLTQLEQVWKATRISVVDSNLPSEVLAQVDRVIAAVEKTQTNADAQQKTVLGLQTRVAELDGRTRHTLNAIERAREAFIRRLLVRDGAPLWSPELWSGTATNLVGQSQHSLSQQAQVMSAYVERKGGRFVLQAGLFLALLAGTFGVRRSLRRIEGAESARAAIVFESPVLTALVLALLASSWIYPQAPRLFWALIGAVSIIPVTLLVRRLIDRRLFPVLNALVVLYLADQLRMLAASQAVLSRVLLSTEVLGGALFAAWMLRPGRFGSEPEGVRFRRAATAGARVALAWCGLAFFAGAVGYVTLGKLLGHALLQSAYLALILYAAARIIDGLISSGLHLPHLAKLGLVKRHRNLIRGRTWGVVAWAAILLWGSFVLEALSLRAPLFEDFREVLAASWQVGSLKISPGDIVLFGLTVWASFFVSRLLRFVLEEEVYSRVKLAPGLHYSISKLVNYAVLVLGFFTGIAVLGFDLTRLTILVGAFGVGLGFGLQNIINNFVSGLILLFERPVKVGDIIQLGGGEGVIKHIGIRASIVRLPNGAEFIVPNGSLISDTVTNWTHSDNLRRIDLPFVVACPAEPRQVMELLKTVAVEQPLILKEPPPQAILASFAADSMNLELRIWVNQAQDWSQVRSELSLAVRAALAEHKIAVK